MFGNLSGMMPGPAQAATATPGTGGPDDDRYVEEEEVTTVPGWTASVTLQVKEQVETGEEHEEELYSQRSKLYRFRDGEWKERGVGDSKLLRHQGTGMVRFMLRQERTHKVVGNHYVIQHPTYCDLRSNAGSDKCWVWVAQDCSDDECGKVEQLALKFGTAQLAEAFREAFGRAKELNSQVPEFAPLAGATPDEDGEAPPAAPAKGASKEESRAPAAADGAAAAASAATEPKPTSAPAPAGLFSGISFNTSGAPTSLFGLSSPAPSGTSASPSTAPGIFGGAFAEAAKPSTAGAEGEDGEYVEEEEVTTVPGWAPSVTLEVKEKIETGEEDEEETYSQRSKLLRFRDGEWKERGIGDAKLLKHRVTGKVRFILRQERTMKVVANHYVISHETYCKLVPNADSDKIWVWTALDCSDGPCEAERFALKFANPELASAFKAMFEMAKTLNTAAELKNGGAEEQPAGPSPSPAATSTSGSLFGAASGPSATGLAATSGGAFSGSLFGATSGGSLFGNSSGSSLFGSGSSGGLFGAGSSNDAGPAEPDDGDDSTDVAPPSSGLFGQPISGSLFGGSAASSGGGLFSGGLFSSVSTGGASGSGSSGGSSSGGLFGTEAASSLFGSKPSTGGSLFGGSGSLFGSAAAATSGGASDEPRDAGAPPATSAGAQADAVEATEPEPGPEPGASGGSLFASAATGGSLFGGGGGLFGGPPATSAATSGGLFAGSGSSSSLFGSGASSSSLFGGGGLFSSAASTGAAGGSTGGLFASASSGGSLFASAAPSSGSLFGSGATPAAASGTAGGSLFAPTPATPRATSAQPEVSNSEERTQQDDDQYVVEEEVTVVPGWTASVTLDVKDRIETGEEDEEVLYSQRSKLYRFRDGEWKERGLGEVKLLQHRSNRKVRLMLRQEKTLKMVANHYVVEHPTYCDLRPNAGSDKVLVWTAQDCADGPMETEKFALRFGTAEVAAKFTEAFNHAKELNREVIDVTGAPDTASPPAAPPTPRATPSKVEEPPVAAVPPASPAPGGTKSKASAVAPKASAPSTAATGNGEAAPPNPFAGITFSMPAATDGKSLSFTSGSLFGGSSGGSLFGSTAGSTGGGLFSSFGTGASSGGGLFAPATPAPPAAPGAAAEKADGDGAAAEDDRFVAEEEVSFVPGWTPSVTLEVKEQILTGEEGQEVMWSQHAKLYRFRDGEWKERGTGEAKLLRDSASSRTRFLLRQEKTMKVMANHWVIDEVPYCDLRPNAGNDRCLVWTTPDSSDNANEPQVEKFALKLATVELAGKFKEAFLQAKAGGGAAKPSAAPAQPTAKSVAAPAAPKFSEQASAAKADDDRTESEPEDDEPVGQGPAEVTGPAMDFGSLAQSQSASGWQCDGCLLRWGDQHDECSVCEVPRPGYEDKKQDAAEKQKSLEAAKAAFLGTSTAAAIAAAVPKASGFGGSFEMPAGGFKFGSGSGVAQEHGMGHAHDAGHTHDAGATGTCSHCTGAPAVSIFGSPAPTTGHGLGFVPTGGTQPIGGAPLFPTFQPQAPAAPAFATPQAAPFTFVGVQPQPPPPPLPPGPLVKAVPVPPIGAAPLGMGSMPGLPVPPPPPPQQGQADLVAAAAMMSTAAGQVRKLVEEVGHLQEQCRRAEEKAIKAEERAKKAASQNDEIEELRHQVEVLRRKQQSESELVRDFEDRQAAQRHVLSSLEAGLKRERMLREALESSSVSTNETLQSVVRGLQDERFARESVEATCNDTRKMLQDVARVAEEAHEVAVASRMSTRERLEALEARVGSTSIETMRKLSLPDRILYYQGLHGRSLGNGSSTSAGTGVGMQDTPPMSARGLRAFGTATDSRRGLYPSSGLLRQHAECN